MLCVWRFVQPFGANLHPVSLHDKLTGCDTVNLTRVKPARAAERLEAKHTPAHTAGPGPYRPVGLDQKNNVLLRLEVKDHD